MKNRLRTVLVTLVTATALVLTGCSLGSNGEDSPEPTQEEQGLPGRVPATFSDQADWHVEILKETLPLTSSYGTIVLQAAEEPDTNATPTPPSPEPSDSTASPEETEAPPENQEWVQVTLLDDQTGEPRWTSESFPVPPDTVPRIALTEQADRDWIMVWFPIEDLKVTLLTLDPSGPGRTIPKPFTYEETLMPVEDSESTPSVRVTSGGVLITGDENSDGPFLYWPETGHRTLWAGGPARGEEPSTPRVAYDGGFVVTYSGGGYGYASDTGGWESSDHAPEGYPATGGSYVSLQRGVLLTHWAGEEEDDPGILVAQNVRNGTIMGSVEEDPEHPFTEIESGPLVAQDASWAVWGGYVLDMTGEGNSGRHDVYEGIPTAIFQGVVYYRDATGVPAPEPSSTPTPSSPPSGTPDPTPGETEPRATEQPGDGESTTSTAEPTQSPTPTPETEPNPEEFDGLLAIDAATGTVVDAQGQGSLVGNINAARGLLIFDGGPGRSDALYSVAVR